jgi:glycosyltransferase involved in cell wall biosynthesis
MMRVAIITTDNREHHRDYNCAEPYFGTAPEALLQGFGMIDGVEVHVVSCTQQQMLSPDKLAPNIWFHSLHVPKTGWLRTGYQGCIRAVRKKLRNINPDIVHGQGTERECSISAVFSGYPNVVTIHGNMAELSRIFHSNILSYNWLAGNLENLTLRRAAGVLCNSAYTQSLVSKRAKQTWLVPNPIRGDFFLPPKSSNRNEIPILLNIGNITPRKRQVELVGLAQQLYENGCRFEMRFIGACGDDEYGRTFSKKIEQTSKQGFAIYEGVKNTEELIGCMDSADGICHFPSEEAFGLVVAEALARNLKFFGGKLGGIIDITSGVSGAELYEPNDFVGLMQGIQRWIKEGHPRPPLSNLIMEERYLPRVIVENHLNIYQEVLNKKQSL